MAIAVNIALGIYVMVRGPRGIQNRVFMGIVASLIVWSVGEVIVRTAGNEGTALLGARIGTPGWCLVGIFFLHLAFLLAETTPGLARMLTLAAGYCIAAGFIMLAWTTDL
ncbi:MAG: hypothetical protein KJ625_04020, partial [Actinobacteria bacterium]|nr:hypothetical protein [Actinomycetota bacterium]